MRRETLKCKVYVIIMLCQQIIASLIKVFLDMLNRLPLRDNIVNLFLNILKQYLLLHSYKLLEIINYGLCIGLVSRICNNRRGGAIALLRAVIWHEVSYGVIV